MKGFRADMGKMDVNKVDVNETDVNKVDRNKADVNQADANQADRTRTQRSNVEKLKKFLSLEIGIEIKACLYFSIIMFFYFCYRILTGSLEASIPLMVEIVLTAYAMSYLQVYLLQNFDEAERFGSGVIVRSLFCTTLYTAVSYLLGWFDRNLTAAFVFFLYMILTYVCVFLIYKLKRDIDTALLNRELEQFKSRKEESIRKSEKRE